MAVGEIAKFLNTYPNESDAYEHAVQIVKEGYTSASDLNSEYTQSEMMKEEFGFYKNTIYNFFPSYFLVCDQQANILSIINQLQRYIDRIYYGQILNKDDRAVLRAGFVNIHAELRKIVNK